MIFHSTKAKLTINGKIYKGLQVKPVEIALTKESPSYSGTFKGQFTITNNKKFEKNILYAFKSYWLYKNTLTLKQFSKHCKKKKNIKNKTLICNSLCDNNLAEDWINKTKKLGKEF